MIVVVAVVEKLRVVVEHMLREGCILAVFNVPEVASNSLGQCLTGLTDVLDTA